MDLLILSTLAIAVLLTLLVILFVTKRFSPGTSETPARRQNNILPGARRRQLGLSRGGRQHTRQRSQNDDDDDDVADDDAPLDLDLPEGKVGAKKLAKLQAKAEKKAQREAEERDRHDKKKKQEIEDEQRKKDEDRQKQADLKREEEERKIREENERKEHEEYLKMKEAFSVESEGFEEGEVEGSNALMDFVNFIKRSKVVVMEDIAAQFKLKTQQAIDRIQSLQSDGILTGVMDDRGKFIYISREELEAVAKFVKQRGRVSINELVDNSNILVDLSPVIPAAAT